MEKKFLMPSSTVLAIKREGNNLDCLAYCPEGTALKTTFFFIVMFTAVYIADFNCNFSCKQKVVWDFLINVKTEP